jgi:hypothetical protein
MTYFLTAVCVFTDSIIALVVCEDTDNGKTVMPMHIGIPLAKQNIADGIPK